MKAKIFIIISTCLLILSCTPKVEQIKFGFDNCAYCEMTISDQKFGSVLLTKKGKNFKFDSVECLSAYLSKKRESEKNVHSLWFVDFNKPKELIELNNSIFVLSAEVKSPMGLNLLCINKLNDYNEFAKKINGKILNWNEVNNYVKEKWN